MISNVTKFDLQLAVTKSSNTIVSEKTRSEYLEFGASSPSSRFVLPSPFANAKGDAQLEERERNEAGVASGEFTIVVSLEDFVTVSSTMSVSALCHER